MSLKYLIGRWLIPPAFHEIINGVIAKTRKDINETLTPIQLRHICRYLFARKHLKGNVVLDAACGAGYGSDLLEPIEKYVGVDYAEYCINFARNNYYMDHRSFIEGDLYSLCNLLQAQSFDTIVSYETLEHLESPEKVLSSFHELLRPEGRLILSIPLNHPDLVYHKRKYSHEDVLALIAPFTSGEGYKLEEYIQNHLQVTPLKNILPTEATGTWLGVLTRQ